jgi:hypothetical protein
MREVRRLRVIVAGLLWQNRWLLLLVMLWPYAMSALLLWPHGSTLQMDDALTILHQEAFYGVAIVAVGSSSQLGKEERSRRIFQVLGRAVSRSEYLLALGLAGWLPLAAFVVSYALNAALLAHGLAASAPALPWFALEQLVAGVFVTGAGLLFAVLLPTALATVATFAVVAITTAAGKYGALGPGRTLAALGTLRFAGAPGAAWLDLLEAFGLGVFLFAAACACFMRRDLRLGE